MGKNHNAQYNNLMLTSVRFRLFIIFLAATTALLVIIQPLFANQQELAVSTEVESGTLYDNASIQSDQNAAGGQFVLFDEGDPSPPNDITYGRRYPTTSTRNPNNVGQITVTPGTYDRVLFDGMIRLAEAGTYVFRDCEVRGRSWGIVHIANSGANVTMEHCTLKRGTPTPAESSSGSGVIHGNYTGTFRYNDISGMGDGMQVGGDNVLIEHNWIHDLAYVWWGGNPNDCATATHNDGIQIYANSNNIRILNNVIDLPLPSDGPCGNGAVFAQGAGQDGQIRGNTLRNGGYTLHLQDGSYAVTGNKIKPGKWGTHNIHNDVVLTEWSNNTNETTGAALNP